MDTGAQQAAKDLGKTITFEGPDSETEVEQQVQLLQTALDRNPAAIGIAALDSAAVAPLLQQAKDRNIPVIAFDSGVDSDIPVTTASTNNLAAAGEAARHMVEAIGGRGKVGVIAHDQTSKTGVDRRDGFVDWVKKNAPNVQIVDIQYGGDPAKAADLASTMLEAHPDLAGLYGTNEGAATGERCAAQRQEGPEDRRIRFGRCADRRDQVGPDAGRDHPEPGGDRQGDRAGGGQGDQRRDAAEDDRHRLLLVRQDQHRRSEDRGQPVPVRVSAPRGRGRHRTVSPAPSGER
nr:substrate-binding domain-containing protein [Tsukamurella sp. 1534]